MAVEVAECVALRIGGASGWTCALMVSSKSGRTLLTVDADGVITLADDLTIAEARRVIEQLAPLVVTPRAPSPPPAMPGEGQ